MLAGTMSTTLPSESFMRSHTAALRCTRLLQPGFADSFSVRAASAKSASRTRVSAFSAGRAVCALSVAPAAAGSAFTVANVGVQSVKPPCGFCWRVCVHW